MEKHTINGILLRPKEAPFSTLAVEVQDVSKRYGQRWVLARLSFTLPMGRSLLLTGPNGSGKTTLLKLLAGLLPPTAGSVKIFDLDVRVDPDSTRRQTALLSHASHLYEDLTARENLKLLADLLAIEDATDKTTQLLETVGLGTRANHPVRQFSAGMRKRLGIARMLMKAPPLVLLDEPFGELDPAGIKQMEKIIQNLTEAGACLILATHLVDQGRALCDEQLALSEGRSIDRVVG